MLKKLTLTCFMLCGFLLLSGFKTTQADNDTCEDKMTQLELNICANEEYKKTDKDLNSLYNKVTKKLNKKEKETLIKAQLNWIKFRDNNCEIYKLIYEGGSIMPLMYSKCLTELTKHRIDELKNLYENLDH